MRECGKIPSFTNKTYLDIDKLDYKPAPAIMALSRVPGDDELFVGGYVLHISCF